MLKIRPVKDFRHFSISDLEISENFNIGEAFVRIFLFIDICHETTWPTDREQQELRLADTNIHEPLTDIIPSQVQYFACAAFLNRKQT